MANLSIDCQHCCSHLQASVVAARQVHLVMIQGHVAECKEDNSKLEESLAMCMVQARGRDSVVVIGWQRRGHIDSTINGQDCCSCSHCSDGSEVHSVI